MGAIKKEWAGFRSYLAANRALVLLAAALTALCYARFVFSPNIRVDSEVFLNEPGTLQGWLSIGRFGQAVYKWLLGNLAYNPYYSGALFLLFFFAGALLWCYLFTVCAPSFRLGGVFAALWLTAQTYAFMFYFSMMAAEVALGILSLPLALLLITRAAERPLRRGWPALVAAAALLIVAFASYQATVTLFITAAAACLLLWLEQGLREGEARNFKLFFARAALYVGVFAAAFALYQLISRLFFSGSSYLGEMIRWKTDSLSACFAALYDYLYATVTGVTGEYSLAFVTGALLTLLWLVLRLTDKRSRGARAALLLTAAVLVGSPYFMALLMGSYPVARTQFALPFCAAFLWFFCANALLPGRRALRGALALGAALLTVGQTAALLRLCYTDDIRYTQDLALASSLAESIHAQFGDTALPVVFLGRWDAPLNAACAKTDIFGISLFAWDCREGEPARNSHRASGFLRAALGEDFAAATPEQTAAAVAAGADMPCWPAEGCIAEADGVLVVKLSD